MDRVYTISAATWQIRQQVLRQYGGVCTCVCGCRDPNLRRLQLHHIYGGGTEERKPRMDANAPKKQLGNRGMNWYRTLLNKPNRNDLHVRCVGCHWEMTLFGVCEHQGFHTVGSQPQPPVVEAQTDHRVEPESQKVKHKNSENCTRKAELEIPMVSKYDYMDQIPSVVEPPIKPKPAPHGGLLGWWKKP